MTNTHLLYELRMLADDALSMLNNGKIERAQEMLAELVDCLDKEYDHACGCDCMECHEPCQMNQDIPDDVDETNYDPYAGCDMFEVDEMW